MALAVAVEKPKKINGAVAEKLTVLTHDMLRLGSCVSLEDKDLQLR